MSDLASALIAALDDDALDALAERLAPRLERRLAASPDGRGWLDSTAAAAHLGISRHALHRLTAERRIPMTQERPGARCYFKRSDLDEWRSKASRGPR